MIFADIALSHVQQHDHEWLDGLVAGNSTAASDVARLLKENVAQVNSLDQLFLGATKPPMLSETEALERSRVRDILSKDVSQMTTDDMQCLSRSRAKQGPSVVFGQLPGSATEQLAVMVVSSRRTQLLPDITDLHYERDPNTPWVLTEAILQRMHNLKTLRYSLSATDDGREISAIQRLTLLMSALERIT